MLARFWVKLLSNTEPVSVRSSLHGKVVSLLLFIFRPLEYRGLNNQNRVGAHYTTNIIVNPQNCVGNY